MADPSQHLPDDTYAKLFDLAESKDPRAQLVFGKLTPQELSGYNQWLEKTGMGGNPEADSYMQTSPLQAAGMAGAAALPLMGAAGAIGPAAGQALNLAKGVGTIWAFDKAAGAIGVPASVRQMMELALGLRMGGKGKPGVGAAAEAEGAAGASGKPLDFGKMGGMSDEQVIAEIRAAGQAGRGANSRVMPDPNLERGVPISRRSPGAQVGPPPNLDRQSGLQATAEGSGPAGSRTQGVTREFVDPAPQSDANGAPLNIERSRSLTDSEAWASHHGQNPAAEAHRQGGVMRKGVQVEGDNVYDAYQDARTVKRVDARYKDLPGADRGAGIRSGPVNDGVGASTKADLTPTQKKMMDLLDELLARTGGQTARKVGAGTYKEPKVTRRGPK